MQLISSQISERIIEFLPNEEPGLGYKKKAIEKKIFSSGQEGLSHFRYSTRIWQQFNRWDLTRHLTTDQRFAIDESEATIHQVNEFILTLQSKGGIAAITSDLTHYKKWPLYSLIGLIRRGDITQAQVASTCMLFQAVEQFIVNPILAICSTPDGSNDINDLNSVIASYPNFYPPKLHTYSIYDNNKASMLQKFFKLTDDGLSLLQKNLQNKPDSEKHFHMFQLPLGPVLYWSPLYQNIISAAPTHPLVFFEPIEVGNIRALATKINAMIIPSFSMIEEYLKITYKKNAMDLTPLIGECNRKTIAYYKLRGKRVIQVGMPEALNPKYAHNLYAGLYCFTLHDIYHAVRDSLIDIRERRAINQIVDRILEDSKDPNAAKLKWDLVDGELYLEGQKFGQLFIKFGLRWNENLKRVVLEDMAKLSSFWDYEFGITPDHLLKNEQEVYNSILETITKADKENAKVQLINYYKNYEREGYGKALNREKALRYLEKRIKAIHFI